MGFRAFYPLFLWLMSIRRIFDCFNGSSSVDSEHCKVTRAVHDGTPRIDNHSNSAHCAGFGWLDARVEGGEEGEVQGSNPPQTQSQSKGLFSLQSSSNLAQNPIPPTRGVHAALCTCAMGHVHITNITAKTAYISVAHGRETWAYWKGRK